MSAEPGLTAPAPAPDPGQHARGAGPERSDSELVVSAAAGSRSAYDVLAARHTAHAYRVAHRITGDHDEAQDAVQDSLIAAWQALPAFRREARFSTWLHRIVANAAVTQSRRARRHRAGAEWDNGPGRAVGPAQVVEEDQHRQAVWLAVQALPPAQRSAIVLYHLQGLSYSAIAEATRSTEPSVRSHLFRGRRALASALHEWR